MKYKCDYCEFVSDDRNISEDHATQSHGVINCDKCEYSALDKSILKKHMHNHTGSILFTCRICEFESTKQGMLKNHLEEKHTASTKTRKFRCRVCEKDFVHAFQVKHHKCEPESKFACQICDFRAVTLIELLEHTKNKPTRKVDVQVDIEEVKEAVLSCDKCEYTCNLNIKLRKHIQKKHIKMDQKNEYHCDSCEYKSSDLPGIWTHKLNKHSGGNHAIGNSPLETIMSILVEQNANIVEEINSLKDGIAVFFNQLGGGIQDNFDYLTKKNNDKNASIKEVLKTIHIKVDNLERDPADEITKSKMPNTSSVPKPSQNSRPESSALPLSSKQSASNIPKGKRRNQYLSKPRVLYVGDSIAHNVNLKHIESKTSFRMTKKKAYNSIYDDRARWPAQNIYDVTKNALEIVPA